MSTKNISVAIPNWNGEDIVAQCLNSVQAAYEYAGLPKPYDIVIVDDHSTDGSAALIRREFPNVNLIVPGEKGGFGKTANRAVLECSQDYVLLLNNDVLLEKDFFVHWQRHFDQADMFALASWMLRWDRKTVDSGRRIGVWDKGLVRHWVVENRGQAAPSLYACGGASIYDRRKFETIGGFDSLFRPMYTEDLDLSYVAWKRGWKTMYEPRCVVYHRNSYSSEKAYTQRRKYLNDTKNHYLFIWKNITDPVLFQQHLAWLPLRVAAAPFQGRRLLTIAFAVALRQLGEAKQRREEMKHLEKISDRAIFELFRPTEYDLAHSPRQGLAGAS